MVVNYLRKCLCIFLSIVSVAILALCVGCAETRQDESKPNGENTENAENTEESENIVLPPARIGKTRMISCFIQQYTFESAMEEAEVVAHVQIGNWLGENNELYTTYFEAKVLQCFKGTISEKFTLSQLGSSECTEKGNMALFTYGNELFLFLKQSTNTTYESTYHIVGNFPTIFDIMYDESGARYYAPRYSYMGDSVDIAVNYALQGKVHSELYARAASADPIITELNIRYEYIFSEGDFMALMET